MRLDKVKEGNEKGEGKIRGRDVRKQAKEREVEERSRRKTRGRK